MKRISTINKMKALNQNFYLIVLLIINTASNFAQRGNMKHGVVVMPVVTAKIQDNDINTRENIILNELNNSYFCNK